MKRLLVAILTAGLWAGFFVPTANASTTPIVHAPSADAYATVRATLDALPADDVALISGVFFISDAQMRTLAPSDACAAMSPAVDFIWLNADVQCPGGWAGSVTHEIGHWVGLRTARDLSEAFADAYTVRVGNPCS